MILFSFVIQYLLYTCFIWYAYNIKGADTDANETVLIVPSTTTLLTVSSTITSSTSTTKPSTANTTANPSKIYGNMSQNIIQLSVTSDTNANDNKINSTKTHNHSKSALPIILALTFGGLAVMVLIAGIIIYVLIKQGRIKIFNQPRTYIKDGKQARIIDSSSTISDASRSRR